MQLPPLDALLRRIHLAPAAPPSAPPAASARDRSQISPQAREALRSAAPTRLTGSFLQFDGSHDAAYWEKTLADMHAVGMDTAIIQYTRTPGTDFSENTEAVLSAADRLGMKVYVGTSLNEGTGSLKTSWYVRQFLPWEVKREGQEVAATTSRLVQQFQHHASMIGVYIPYEVNGLAPPRAIGDFYGAIANAAKQVKPDLKVMIAPYTALIPAYAPSPPAFMIASWWDQVLARAHVDVLAWQDGVGGAPDRLRRAVDPDLSALAQATSRHGVELWADLESFQRTGSPSSSFAAAPESLDTLVKQLRAEAPHVAKLVNFDFNHYMSPQAGPEAAQLYQRYRDYLATKGPVASEP